VEDLKKFARYFRKYKLQLALGIACIFTSVVVGLLIPLIVGQAIDANWAEVSWPKLTVSAAKVLGASVVSGIFLFLQRRILIGMSRNIEYDMRQEFYAHLGSRIALNGHSRRRRDVQIRDRFDAPASHRPRRMRPVP
jgi:ATP-binding cassette subfamily B protein